MAQPNPTASWLWGTCAQCGLPVVVTQSASSTHDYLWYCSNKDCVRHHPGTDTGDQDLPEWVTVDAEGKSQIGLFNSSPLFRHVWYCPIGWMDGKLLWSKGMTEQDAIRWLVDLRRIAGIENPEGVRSADQPATHQAEGTRQGEPTGEVDG